VTASITHSTVVVVADDGTSPVGTTEWNAAHVITGTIDPANGGTGAGAFTAGSIVFAGASGVYTQDNANLFWDDTNNYLKLGSAAQIFFGTDITLRRPGLAQFAIDLGNGAKVDFGTTTANGFTITAAVAAAGGALHVLSPNANMVSIFEATAADCYNRFVSTTGTGEYGIWSDALYFQSIDTLARGIQLIAGSAGAIADNGQNISFISRVTGVVEQIDLTRAQSFRVYNTFASTTSYERGIFDWTLVANRLSIGTDKGSGGGLIRALQFVVGGANALDYGGTDTARWTFLAGLTTLTGTATAAPVIIPAGTLLTTAAAGSIENDGKAFYSTNVASSRQVISAEQVLIQNATRSFTSNTNPQTIFNASTNGAVTLAASTTYEFEMQINATGFANTAHTFNLSFLGTATFSSIGYYYDAQSATTLITPTASLTGYVAVATATPITASATSTGLVLYARGTMRINAGGTVIPTLTQVGATGAGIMGINSFFRCWPVGSNTVTNVGNWS
jgi:hypothetical protein